VGVHSTTKVSHLRENTKLSVFGFVCVLVVLAALAKTFALNYLNLESFFIGWGIGGLLIFGCFLKSQISHLVARKKRKNANIIE
jgi:hypothetical protein